MSRRPLGTWIVVVALIVAIAVWIGYAYRALELESHIVASSDRPWLLGIVLIGCALDALVGVRVVRARIGLASLMWLAFRLHLSIVGFLFFTAPSYAIAFFVLASAPRFDPRTDPLLPHAYRPISAGWFGALTPLWWSQSLIGASQIGASACVVCRADRDAPLHSPAA